MEVLSRTLDTPQQPYNDAVLLTHFEAVHSDWKWYLIWVPEKSSWGSGHLSRTCCRKRGWRLRWRHPCWPECWRKRLSCSWTCPPSPARSSPQTPGGWWKETTGSARLKTTCPNRREICAVVSLFVCLFFSGRLPETRLRFHAVPRKVLSDSKHWHKL